MNIKELVQSTGRVKNRDKATVFGQKKFGKIMVQNQTVLVRRNGTVIDISMMISGVTDKITTSQGKQPVAYHKVTLSIKGIDQTYYTPKDFVATVRATHKEFADEKDWPAADIMKQALEKPDAFFKDATVFRATNDREGGFCVVSNKIPETSEVKVWCSCSDYYWTFQYYNCEKDVDVWGRYPDRYIPKTKAGFEAFKSKQPIRNPGRHPGMCKHVMLLLATLMDKGVVEKGTTGVAKFYRANYGRFKEERYIGREAYDNRIKRYQADHQRKVYERRLERGGEGYADFKGYKRNGWGWNPKTHKFKGM